MKFKFHFFLAIAFLFPSAIFCQGTIGFDFDYAKFNYDNESNYLEIYYSLSPSTLSISKTDSGNFISINLGILLTSETNEKTLDETYNLANLVDTTSPDFYKQDLVGVLGFRVPFGKKILTLAVKDNYNSSNNKKIVEKLEFVPFNNPVQISDIELCSNIIHEGANPNSIYYKNNLELVPNPKSIYGANSPVLFYYTEIYENAFKGDKKNLKISRTVHKNGALVHTDEEKLVLSNAALVKAGLLNVSKYSSGGYTIALNILDIDGNLVGNSSKKFFIYNPGVVEEVSKKGVTFVGSEYDFMNEDDCDYNFAVTKYIAAESEIRLYEKLSQIDAKRRFLFDFWNRRNPDQISSNDMKQKYMEKVEYVNSNYGNRFKEGYKTDRGRVVLVYGKPDRVDTFNSESTLKPYEIWYYDSIEGGITFIFGDTMGAFDLELLHSTKRGEIRNENWGDRISVYGRND